MREIKFRGKLIAAKNHWVYGAYIPAKISSWEEDTIFDGQTRWVVDPNTIGQYTGYKDVDGKEIYDGDVLEDVDICKYRRIVRFGEYANVSDKEKYNYGFYVDFLSERIQKMFRKELLFWVNHYGHWKCRVVGNIYDSLKPGEQDDEQL